MLKKRMHNIFKEDGKTFILAFDHGAVMNIGQKVPNPGRIIDRAREGGTDVLLTTGGVADAFADRIGSMGLIIRADGGTTINNATGPVFEQLFSAFSIEECNRLGADGVISMYFSHVQDEVLSIQKSAKYYSECKRFGLCLCIEALPGGFSFPKQQTLENIAFSARLACEMGADFIKVPFVGDAKTFREQVVDRSFRPIVVLGGGGQKSDAEILTDVRTAMDAGCKGVAYGRLLWSHTNLTGICSAISKIIHEDATVEEALRCCK